MIFCFLLFSSLGYAQTACENGIFAGDFTTVTSGTYSSIPGWTPVGTDQIRIVTQNGNNGALIRNVPGERYSLEQVISSLKPSTTYAMNFSFGNWTNGCSTSAMAKIKVEVIAGGVVVFTNIIEATNSTTPTTETLSFTVPASASSVTVRITDGGSPTANCGGFIDNVRVQSALEISTAAVNVSCFGEADGGFTISASGSVAPYSVSYSISGDPSPEVPVTMTNGAGTVANLEAGTYIVTVKDANNCSEQRLVSIIEPDPLIISAVEIDNVCYGETNGSVNITVAGGTAPYTYLWSNGEISEDISNLGGGRYSVTVTDSRGCTQVKEVIITPTDPLTLSETHTAVLCNGGTTSVTLSASGGNGTYQFRNGSGPYQSGNIFVVTAGSHDFYVRDSEGCERLLSFNISEPPALTLNLVQTNVKCNGELGGAIDLSVSGGVAPYTYNWSNGADTQDLTNLGAGSYTVTVTDANNCSRVQTFTISQPDVLEVSYTKTDVNCYGGNTGQIDLTVTGGTAPYTYSWNNLSSSEDQSAVGAGNYEVTVTDSEGCISTKTIIITQPLAPLTISSTQTNINCYGSSTGSINLSVTGGTAPYTFSWNNGSATQNLNGLSSGTYTVTVRDLRGCTATATIAITQPTAPLTLTEVHADVRCFGGNDGAIDLSVSGGTAPYTYSWSNGAVSQDISSLVAGTYIVTVRDANGCVANANVDIGQQASELTAGFTKTDVSCYGQSTGSISLTVSGGTAPYSYLWSNGSGNEDLSNLAAGVYNVTITDASGCTRQASITITQPPTALTVSSTQTNISCYGSSTGVIDITATGGTAPYVYSWSNGSVSQDLNNIPSGTYTVTVTDLRGCIATAAITTTQPAAPLTLTEVHADVRCFGGNNGAIDLSVSGGSAPYTYSWSNGAVTQDISSLVSDTYIVTVRDANGCTATLNVAVNQPPTPVSIQYSKTNVLGNGDNTGAIDLTVTGGSGSYTYSWSNSANTEDLTGLAAGSYTVLVTDSRGCIASETIIITEPSALIVERTLTNVNCSGTSTGAIDLQISGGVAPYTYLWNNGAQTQDLNNIPAGSYTVTVSDLNGQSVTATYVITQPAAVLSLIDSHNNVSCFEGNNGSIDLTTIGGTAPYTYLWSNGATAQDITDLTSGTYTVIVRDSRGCTATRTVAISQPSAALFITPAKTNVSCFGESSGAIDITVSGGTAPYTYSWSNGSVSEDLINLPAGMYIVTVTDAAGCTTSFSTSITQPAQELVIGGAQTNVNCFGAATGAINLNVTGGTGPYSYSWSNGGNTPGLSGLAAGSYTVTVTDNRGCSKVLTFNITQPLSPLTSFETHANVNCYGNNTGSIDLSVSGGTLPYTYLWSNGSNSQDVTGLTAGTYMVIIRDGNGCMTSRSITISQPPAPIQISFIKTDVSCYGDNTGSIDLTLTGGTAPYTYSWSNGADDEDLTALGAGEYTVTVRDSKGCTAIQTIRILQPAAVLSLNTSHSNVNCFGASTGSINLTVTGGTSPYIYAWNNSSSQEDLVNLPAGTYSVTVTDLNGCTASASVIITEPMMPLTLNSTQVDVNCKGSNTGLIRLSVIGGTGPYTFLWSNGATTRDVSNLTAGNYSVTVTDFKGCTATRNITISEPASELLLSETHTDIGCYGDNTASIDLTVTGGTAPYRYSWSNYEISEDLSTLGAGTYTVLVTDARRCSKSLNVTITQPESTLSAIYSKNDVNCFGGNTGSIDLTVTGGTLPYSYSWSNGSVGEDLNDLTEGVYRVTITDARGCVQTVSVNITQPFFPLVVNESHENIRCFGYSSGSIDLSVIGGTAPYSFNWSNGATSRNLTGLPAGIYTVSITDARGCAATRTITILQPAQGITLSSTQQDVTCHGGNTGSIDLAVTGGAAPYTYSWSNLASSEDLSGLTAGSYTVTVTDSQGCSSVASFTILEPSPLVLTDTQIGIACSGPNTGAINLSVTGGVAPYNFQWSNGSASEDISGLAAGTYSVTVTDNYGCTATHQVTIPSFANAKPVAVNESFEGTEDAEVSGNVGTNDSDEDNCDVLNFTKLTDPINGSVTLNNDGTFIFTPDRHWYGTSSFTYLVCDRAAGIAGGECSEATTIITITPVNDAPVALDDAFAGTEGVAVNGQVGTNDTDIDNDPLIFEKLTDPANGTLVFNNDGTFIFTPDPYWNGTTHFSYRICDRPAGGAAVLCSEAVVTITIAPLNNAPEGIVSGYTYTTPEDIPLNSDVNRLVRDVDNIGTELVFTKISDPEHGTVTINANGIFIYIPEPNYYGPDQFTVQVEDGSGGTAIVVVPVTVTPVNDPPVAVDDRYYTRNRELQVRGNVLDNDSDLERDALIATLLTRPSNGTLQFNEDGSFTFIPRPGFAGDVTFTYQACDNGSPRYCSNVATVTITILPLPVIGLAKSVTTPVRELDGSYTFTYDFTVRNYGNVDLEDVQITDDLESVFVNPARFTVRGLTTTGSLAVNKNYNGSSFKDLFESGNRLAIGETQTVSLTINVLLNGTPGTFNNQAEATGHAEGDITTDRSHNGIEPDPNNDGSPSEESPTPVSLELSKIYVPGGFSPNGDGVNDKFIIENTGTDRINLEVFNRWGNVIFKDADYKNDWEGTSTQGIRIGDQAPDGTYFYVIVVNNSERLVGYITIKR